MSKPEPEKIIDLDLLPYRFGPFKTYAEYLLWKLSSMKLKDSFRLHFFSAFVVKRYAEGYILENTATGQLWAAEVTNYPKLLDFIETQQKQTKATMSEKALIRCVTAYKLYMRGLNAEQVASQLKTSRFRAQSYITYGNLELIH